MPQLLSGCSLSPLASNPSIKEDCTQPAIKHLTAGNSANKRISDHLNMEPSKAAKVGLCDWLLLGVLRPSLERMGTQMEFPCLQFEPAKQH